MQAIILSVIRGGDDWVGEILDWKVER